MSSFSKKILFSFLLLILVSSVQKAVAQTCANPVVKDQSLVPDLPPFRDQDGEGFCYAFAALMVIEQKYCHEKIGGCHFGIMSEIEKNHGKMPLFKGKALNKLSPAESREFMKTIPDDRLSIFDLIAKANKGELVEGGFPADVLKKIKSGRLAKESCASFGKITYNSVIKANDPGAWWKQYRKIYERYHTLSDDGIPRKSSCARELVELLPGENNLADIQNALDQKTYGQFIAQLSVPKNCEKSSIVLPSYQVHEREVHSTKDPLAFQIQKLIRAGTPAIASLCTAQASFRDPFNSRCDAHANVIVGIRTLCCGSNDSTCRQQYRLRDSAFPRFDPKFLAEKNTNMEDLRNGWEDSSTFTAKMLKYESRSDKSSLTWIE